MKKAAIIVCAAVYALAIIIVAFLGYRAEVRHIPLKADDIVLTFPVPYTEVSSGGVAVYKIQAVEPAESNSEEDTEATKKDYRYDVVIYDIEYFCFIYGGKINIKCKPISNKVDAETGKQRIPDELNLNYAVLEPEVASATDEGVVEFNPDIDLEQYPYGGSIDVMISTHDGSKKTIFIRIVWGGN